MKIVDTRGHLCPEPLIMTRKAIAEGGVGDEFEVVSNNATARGNLINFLGEMGIDATCTERGGEYFIRFVLGAKVEKSASIESFCTPVPKGGVVVLKSELMGAGDEKLGALLMRAFLNSLSEIDRLPSAVVAYNGGVKLCVEGSDSAAALHRLKDKGVRIVACGTCVDFFDIKSSIAVAEIGNMLLIARLTTSALSVIYP